MMTDPYAVLGLTPGASDDEVKAAYRNLAKKYHPDRNQGDKYAEQKMKEVNEAYDLIMRKKNTSSYGGGQRDYSSYANYGGSYSGQGSVEMEAARNYIASGHYYEAINVLSSIANRTAEWYYLSALAYAGTGNRMDAMRFAQQAVAMEPDNMRYRELLQQMQGFGQAYQTNARRYVQSMPGLGLCLGLCLVQRFCPFCLFC